MCAYIASEAKRPCGNHSRGWGRELQCQSPHTFTWPRLQSGWNGQGKFLHVILGEQPKVYTPSFGLSSAGKVVLGEGTSTVGWEGDGWLVIRDGGSKSVLLISHSLVCLLFPCQNARFSIIKVLHNICDLKEHHSLHKVFNNCPNRNTCDVFSWVRARPWQRFGAWTRLVS